MSAHPLEPRIARLEGSFDQINQRLASHEQSTSTRFDHVDSRFDHVDRRFDQMDRRFNWLAGLVVATWITTIMGIIFHR